MRSKNFLPNWRRGVLMVLFFCPAILSFAQNLQLVSALNGQPSSAGNGESCLSMVTPDGRYALFSSTANNLVATNSDGPVPGLRMPRLNVFLRDRIAGTTTLVSVNPAGGSADEDCEPTGVSTNGQYALFESTADNLTAGCTNTIKNIFVRDLINNTTTLVSVSTNGAEGNGNSYESSMTPSGRYVVFASAASNLVANVNNGIPNVFVRDLLSNTTTLVSTGAVSIGSFTWLVNGSGTPQITPDGRYVAFCSSAVGLAPGATSPGDIYVRDLVAGTTIWASTNARSLYQSVAGKTNVTCCNEVISTNGQFVAFEVGTNLGAPGLVLQFNLQTLATTVVSTNANVPAATESGVVLDNFNKNIAMTPNGEFIAFVANGTASATNTAIYLWSAQTGTNILISPDLTSGLPAVGICEEPVLDTSGQYVAYLSSATNLTTNVISSGYHVYVWSAAAGTQLADAGTNGVGVGVYPTAIAALSDDGSVFFDQALANANLVTNDSNTGSDVFAFHSSTGTMELVSACQPGQSSLTPNGFTKLYSSCVSTNGRYIAFASEADNLLADDTNQYLQVFVRDVLTGTNILVSADTNGLPGTAPSIEPSISGDGRYVAFSSYANNLVTGSINNENVFVRDLQSATTTLVSVNTSGGVSSGDGDSYTPTISSDGRYILFYSKANNLNAASPVQSLGVQNLYLSDQLLATNYALTTGTASPIGGVAASMTPDGRYIAYIGAINGNGVTNLYVWDSQAGSLIYTNTLGSSGFAISPDGSWLADVNSSGLWAINLTDNTSNLVATGTFNSTPGLQFSTDDASLVFVQSNHVYLYDFQTGTNLLVDRSYDSGGPANGRSGLPAISPNGRFVAYYSTATNIVPNDAAANGNIYLYDWTNNATTLISLNLAGTSTGNYWSLAPEFSADGSTLVFQSYASDLSSLAFNEFGAVFALDLSSYSGTNSTGTNVTFSAQIGGLAASGQNPPNVNPVINWTAAPGNSYQVQFTDDLNDPVWQAVDGNMIFIGNDGEIIDLTPAATQRFYRVIAVPGVP